MLFYNPIAFILKCKASSLDQFIGLSFLKKTSESQTMSASNNSSSNSQPEKTIFEIWDISKEEISDLVRQNPSLRGVMLGYVAEMKFHKLFLQTDKITSSQKDDDHDRTKKGDRRITYKGKEFIIEVKSLQTNTVKKDKDGWIGKTQVDGSDRRILKFSDGTELNTTLLKRGEFDILAVNCFAFENKWKFVFARNADLPCSKFKKYTEAQQKQLIASLVEVSWPPKHPFYEDLYTLLDHMLKD